MQRFTFIKRLQVLAAIALTAGFALASAAASPAKSASPLPGPAGTIWTYQTIASAGQVGEYNSLGIDPTSGTMVLSYYDVSNQRLQFAWGPTAGGDCIPSNQWRCYPINSTTNVGAYSSLAFNPVDGSEAVAYQDVTNHALLYSAFLCSPACVWQTTVIDKSALVGQGISLKFDAIGKPHIAYYQLLPTAALKYAQYVGGGTGNCFSSDWQCDTIESGPALGQYPSLDLDALGKPHIAYYDAYNGWLKYASQVSGGAGNCNGGTVSTAWECGVIDSSADVGAFASLHQSKCFLGPCNDSTQIAYYDTSNHILKYAHYTGATVQCSGLGTVGVLTSPALYISLAVFNGIPYIAYNDRDDGTANGRLKLASPTADVGNCGPNGGLFQTWQCSTLDSGNTLGVERDVGQYPSIAINSAGLLYVAYYDATNGDLKIAYEQLPVYMPLVVR